MKKKNQCTLNQSTEFFKPCSAAVFADTINASRWGFKKCQTFHWEKFSRIALNRTTESLKETPNHVLQHSGRASRILLFPNFLFVILTHFLSGWTIPEGSLSKKQHRTMLQVCDALNSLHCFFHLQNKSHCADSGINRYFKSATSPISYKNKWHFCHQTTGMIEVSSNQNRGSKALTVQLEMVCSPGLTRLPLRHKNHKVTGFMASHGWRRNIIYLLIFIHSL